MDSRNFNTLNNIPHRRSLFLFIILCILFSININAQNTVFKGIVKDSITQEVLPYVTIQFDKTNIGVFSNEDGTFSVSNSKGHTDILISFIGYETQKFKIPAGKTTQKTILLANKGKTLKDVVIRPKKEKYSKKNNPAVELIQKVIANKEKNYVQSADYVKCKEYEQLLFALNDFKPDGSLFKNFKFLPNYMVTSEIDNKPILPISLRETSSEKYYRKAPKTEKKVVTGHAESGIDVALEIEGLDAALNEIFKDVSIYDNSMTLLLHEFVSPLSDQRAVSFFRWYIVDTIMVDNQSCINLAFVPFNTRDIGFTGNLLITNDDRYAVKKAVMRAPTKMNMNFVDEMIIIHTFEEIEDNKWAPLRHEMAIDMSWFGNFKGYVSKSRTYHNYDLATPPNDSIYKIAAPVTYAKNFDNRPQEFWFTNRPPTHQIDYRVDDMLDDVMDIGILKGIMNTARFIFNGGYFPTRKGDRNKIDIGSALSAYSYNSVEGNQFRLTARTTPRFNRHLFLYAYGAYGLRDNKFKYYAEATWAFKKQPNNKDEFPKDNLKIGYRYDVSELGQKFKKDRERDNFMTALRSTKNVKMTYKRESIINWEKEYYNGFSHRVGTNVFDERPAGKLKFEYLNEAGELTPQRSIRGTEMTVGIRYAPNEKIMQYQRSRYSIPSPGYSVDLSLASSAKGLIGSQYSYNKVSLLMERRFWIAKFGKVILNLEAQKLWGEAPFPLLLTPSANSSYTIQKGSFYLLDPLEFIHDQQVTFSLDYRMGGLIFNRIPLLNMLNIREIIGVRGVYGELSKRNNPLFHDRHLRFPENAFEAKNKPYIEYNIGVENIFSFLRIDYVRRLNYRDHPGVKKQGVRVSVEFTF